MVDSETPRAQQTFLPDTGDKQPYERRYRWVMLALVWVAYFTFGLASFSLPPLVSPILEDLNISYSQMGIILGAWPLTYVVVAVIGGAILDRWGIRRSIFAGIAFIGLSEILRYFAGGFGALFLCVALFGLGGPMISIGSPKTISLWFRGKERGTAVGIYMTGTWIGGAAAIATTNSVVMPLTGYSWRLAFICFGALAFVVALLWWFLAWDVKPDKVTESPSINKVFIGLISLRNVQLILVMGLISFAIGHGFTDWLPKILESGGLSPSLAGYAASLPIWIAIPFILVVPRLVAPHFRARMVALMCLVVTTAILLITMTPGASMVVGLVIYSMNYCILPLLILILMDIPEVGSKYMGSASGMFFCVAELGGFLGPLMVGAIKDLAGGFLAGAFLLASLSLIMVVIALLLKVKYASH